MTGVRGWGWLGEYFKRVAWVRALSANWVGIYILVIQAVGLELEEWLCE
jgi:hypothetical protein